MQTHAVVLLESEEQGAATYSVLHGLQWPQVGHVIGQSGLGTKSTNPWAKGTGLSWISDVARVVLEETMGFLAGGGFDTAFEEAAPMSCSSGLAPFLCIPVPCRALLCIS